MRYIIVILFLFCCFTFPPTANAQKGCMKCTNWCLKCFSLREKAKKKDDAHLNFLALTSPACYKCLTHCQDCIEVWEKKWKRRQQRKEWRERDRRIRAEIREENRAARQAIRDRKKRQREKRKKYGVPLPKNRPKKGNAAKDCPRF